MPNPFLDRAKKDGKTSVAYRHAPKQEKSLAKRFGGIKTPASGAKVKKGDVQVKDLVRIEAKTTSADSFRVTKEMLRKIQNAGLGSSELPVMVIEFLGPRGKSEGELAVLSITDLEMLIHAAKENR
jgi:hypothetical protein